jgi:hypothetical protein
MSGRDENTSRIPRTSLNAGRRPWEDEPTDWDYERFAEFCRDNPTCNRPRGWEPPLPEPEPEREPVFSPREAEEQWHRFGARVALEQRQRFGHTKLLLINGSATHRPTRRNGSNGPNRRRG